MTSLVTAHELRAELASPAPPRILDVRWRLDRPDGRAEYRAGHIPSAVYVDLDTQLARHGAPEDGRHPLPSAEQFEQSARSWGIRSGDRVVVYDDLNGLSAARAWWLLRYAGVGEVRLLDGSLRAWLSAGFALEVGDVMPDPGDLEVVYGGLPVLTIDEAAAFPQAGVLLDARAGERYRGDAEPVDPRAGHIPGALSAPAAENVDAEGRFLPPEGLRERFATLGITEATAVASYCGSGVTASHNILALALAGFDAALYPGSWSQWANHPARPVVTGEQPL
ncbi:sulfurtransferase [Protaetiibacter larvae]|uniref:Sulfurtransferase n=1 Tax=Protaetiibacter larvae TaxID=2592654 RepID=A0A5C1Y8G7_9MICO|nr:sulfurtransferase [Protaetiibacter larvae]QEO09459.1 sulfurtransferase [Protaetiibacter larvae]